jgi:hypothetical protein
MDQLSAAGVPALPSAQRGRLRPARRVSHAVDGHDVGRGGGLLLAGAGSAAADLGIGADAAAGQLKLLASLPPDSGASAERVSSRFHLDPVQWYRRAEVVDILPALASAVWRDRRIRVRYESWKELVTRELDPLGLVLKAGIWYLVAAAGGQPRTYRVSNIRELTVLEGKFRRPQRFQLARYWQAWARDFEARPGERGASACRRRGFGSCVISAPRRGSRGGLASALPARGLDRSRDSGRGPRDRRAATPAPRRRMHRRRPAGARDAVKREAKRTAALYE